MKLLAAVAFGLACAHGAAAEEDWKVPDWRPIGELRAEDKALSDEVFLGACAAGETECDSRRGAVISLGGRRGLLLLQRYSMGSCGDYDFYLFGPAGSGGKRPAMPEFSYCAGALKYRPNGPDFLVSGVRVGSDISGPSGWVFEDVRLRRERGAWTESVVMVIQYQDGKPKVLQKN